ncbi:GtrA family protein [Burkholderia stagnalis]|uniref:GtrA family protein n=1 Tax=Burkholderia stagnalis TaxID=1503054 RepID=UPI0007560C93|nr:GtrA family protein [Burkholderia stagnalis]AOK53144.1 hypothetical protein WT74_10825 [Burkholderia stagnalis]KWI99892.1 hypothetical protein WT76_25790 [Burkholderia stagnalis]KWO34072.1 hypothetical protein WT96_20375 [Burkholderia stagnalis]
MLSKMVNPTEWFQLARYGGVGALCAAMNLAILYVGTGIFGLHYLLSCVWSFGILAPLSYVLHKRISFRGDDPNSAAQFMRYVASLLTSTFMNVGLLALLANVFHIHYLLAAVLSTALSFLCGYVYQSSRVFCRGL